MTTFQSVKKEPYESKGSTRPRLLESESVLGDEGKFHPVLLHFLKRVKGTSPVVLKGSTPR